jgi:hypothetical protein
MSMSKLATCATATSVRADDSGLRSFAGSAEGSLPAPEAAALAPIEDLLGPGAAGFAAGVVCYCQGQQTSRLTAPSSPREKGPRPK